MKLGDLGVTAEFEELSDTLYTINKFGGADGLYVYMTAETAAEYNQDGYNFTAGWYLMSEVDAWEDETNAPVCQNDVAISIGQMVCVSSPNEGAAIVAAGQVASEDISLVLDNTGRNFLVNCTPVKITLGDVLVTDAFEELSDTLYTINKFGGADAIYVYMTAETAAEYNQDGYSFTAGWYLMSEIDAWEDETNAPVCQNNVEVPAGSGFVVSSPNDGAAIIIPSAL